MNAKRFTFVVLMLVFGLLLVACGGGQAETVEVTRLVEVTRVVEVAGEGGAGEMVTFAGGGDTLGAVQDRGILNCGVSGSLPGFSFLEEDGSVSGFDWDYCRAIAAAALGDADAVQNRNTNASERFPVLQSGEIDVLVRNTTWTVSRDTSLGFNFAPTTFYDGQGMLVRKDSGITTLEDLEGGTVCVNAGTTTEKNLADVFRTRGISYEPVVFAETDAERQAYDEGRCDGWTTDKSGLVASKTQLTVPEDHIILEETMSKEPLGPLVRHGDDNWFDIVKWTVNCTIMAEDLGVDSSNVDEMLGSDNPEILNLLGVEGDLGQAMGLNNDFCYQVISQVGNYAEIYDKNLGPFDLPRGLNAQWKDGGILYSPPFR
jgi:general L-amino acid transport system substrate-binding protein